MSKSKADEKILSYNDVVLRRSDLDILGGPYFLNDRIIEFYLSYLSSFYPSSDILLVPPSIAFWVIQCPFAAALKDFLEPLHLSEKELVLFPVNDNEDVNTAEGGSHWSLLAYYRNANLFVHHDSCRSLNSEPAMKLYKAVVEYVGLSESGSEARYLECTDSPKQVNGYDCGLYVTAIARVICDWHVNGKKTDANDLWFSVVKERVTSSSVHCMRTEILVLIRDLMEKHSGQHAQE